MTHITIYKSKQQIVGFESKGHSGYAEAGKDIVCSAISVLVLNTLNSLEKLTQVEFEGSADENEAFIEFRITGKHSRESLVLCQSLELGLSQLAKENPKYVSIQFKEV